MARTKRTGLALPAWTLEVSVEHSWRHPDSDEEMSGARKKYLALVDGKRAVTHLFGINLRGKLAGFATVEVDHASKQIVGRGFFPRIFSSFPYRKGFGTFVHQEVFKKLIRFHPKLRDYSVVHIQVRPVMEHHLRAMGVERSLLAKGMPAREYFAASKRYAGRRFGL